MKIAYADPPYPGQSARRYGKHPDYAGEVDHAELLGRLHSEYDGWVLHTSSTALPSLIPLVRSWHRVRVMAWVKPWASFKPTNPIAYAWEPVIVKAARVPPRYTMLIRRDWIASSMTMKKGLAGVKPEDVCRWAFVMVGAKITDSLDDLYPGSGAVTSAWHSWCDDVRDLQAHIR